EVRPKSFRLRLRCKARVRARVQARAAGWVLWAEAPYLRLLPCKQAAAQDEAVSHRWVQVVRRLFRLRRPCRARGTRRQAAAVWLARYREAARVWLRLRHRWRASVMAQAWVAAMDAAVRYQETERKSCRLHRHCKAARGRARDLAAAMVRGPEIGSAL